MKIPLATFLLIHSLSVSAYAPAPKKANCNANRRQTLQNIGTTTAGTAFAFVSQLLVNPGIANAKRPEYLTEPTAEFVESERQRTEFKQTQLKIKQEFVQALDRLTNESNSEEALVKDLQTLKSLVTSTGGMPLGIKKEDMVKIIRRKKSQGYWPTSVEIAYQDLIREILFQQSPNKEKDTLSVL